MAERLLIVGSDGRSQALAWKLLQDNVVESVALAPGNGGTHYLGDRAENVDIGINEFDKQVDYAKENDISLVVYSPESPLIRGSVDVLTQAGVDAFGPKALEAQIEGSKIYSAKFNQQFGIPQPEFFYSYNFEEIRRFIEHSPWGNEVVVKADGEAAGKGVTVTHSTTEAIAAAKRVMVDKVSGDAGEGLLLQRRVGGREASVIIITDGSSYKKFPILEDHKAVGDGDEGPNTGGMGVVGPVAYIDTRSRQIIDDVIIPRALQGFKEITSGRGYRGALYIGLMIDEEPKVIEYNCRFGDPETQAHMRLLQSKLLPLLTASRAGTLDKRRAIFHRGAAASVTLAAQGYPGIPKLGDVIEGLETITDDSTIVFHAGTRRQGDQTITSGGRVLSVTAFEPQLHDDPQDTLLKAVNKAYTAIGSQGIHFNSMIYRRDIGRRK